MGTRRKILIGAAGVATAGVLAALAIRTASREQVKVLTGVVLRDDAEVRKQVPVANAQITADDTAKAVTKTDASGLFHLNFRPGVRVGESIAITVTHPNYWTLDTAITANNELYVFRMTPVPRPIPKASGPEVTVTNARVRYAVTETTTINVGSAAETFDVVNRGYIPCEGSKTCSPDGKWKAAVVGKSLDAGDGNSFEDIRVTCIAGPCGFTRIENNGFSTGARHIEIRVRNWSDTTSFLFEAEVTHTMASDAIRQLYPAKFGEGMDFTLPATGEGPSIEAEVGGADIVYPLGPLLILSWATCSLTVAPDQTKLYHCDLKPGYRFK